MEPIELRFIIAADHPCLDGHFPGRPVVPAVVLLDEILSAARRHLSGVGRLRAVSNAKFLQPVLPEQAVTVSLDLRDAGATIEFRCRTAAGVVAQGRFLVEPPQ